MDSAFMARDPHIDWRRMQGVIYRVRFGSTRPFTQNRKKTDDVLGYLSGILIGKRVSDTRLPDGMRLLD
jgi:hypothetical protein